MAMASLYRCAYDGITRTSCCCSSGSTQHRKPAAAPDAASLRSTGCCTITQGTAPASTARADELMPVDGHPVAVPIALAIAPAITAARRVAEITWLVRARAQGDPPDTLFARRCSLLL